MNRNNFWIHAGLAAVMITVAAVLGQMERWRTALRGPAVSVAPRAQKDLQPGRKFTPGSAEVLVRFRPGINMDRIRSIAFAHHDEVVDEIEAVSGLTAIDDLDNADPAVVSGEYAAMADAVVYAEPNYRISLDDPIQKAFPADGLYREPGLALPNDPHFGDQYALHNTGQDGGKDRADIDALDAWKTTKGSPDVVVAVLDSGVDFTHVDLKENMWFRPEGVPAYTDNELGTFNDINGFDGTDRIADPMDDNGHGTHCAGIIGAEGDNLEGITGVNWHVKIMPLKFLGRGGFGSTDDAIEAINYAIDRKRHGVNIRIISASWGSTSNSRALEDTIRAAGEAGILFIAAAGNDGSNNDKRPHYPSNYDLPNVVSVAATDRNDQLAGFSNFGIKSVHVAAPGKDILSTWLGNAYRDASGTSMATPYVSGVAALIVAHQPNISMEKLRQRLLASVDKIPALDGKVATGGRINAAKAVAE